MGLSQIHLEAFSEVAKLGSFTKAADSLGLTQSALSHRIRNLEEDLAATVFIRIGNKIQLTDSGRRLLQFCQVQQQAEEELLNEVKPQKHRDSKLAGRLRVGGVSSLMRSLALPAASKLIRDNPSVRLDFLVKELSELKNLLLSGQVDFLISTEKIQTAGIEEEFLGYEENVLVASTSQFAVGDVYLDHDQDDQTTFEFFKLQGRKNVNLIRSFLDDIYGVLDAVSSGIGKAVIPLHLASSVKGIEVVKGHKPLLLGVYLYHFKQPYYTQLHHLSLAAMKRDISAKLRQKA